jgi:hypothetical protein
MSSSNGKPLGKRSGGAPKGNSHALTHGLVALRNEIKRRTRRGRDRIDKRTAEGKEALEMRSGVITDRGGLDNLTTVEFGVIVGYSEAWWLRAMQYRATSDYLKKNPHRRSSPAVIAKLVEYASRADNNVAKYSQLHGHDKKPPPAKSL